MNDQEQPLSQRVISIRTPENIELAYALAGAGSRATAYAIDAFIMVTVCQLCLNLILYALMLLFRVLGAAGELWAAGVATLVWFAFYTLYFVLFEWLWNGQTPGKRVLHLRVIKQGGYALRFFDTLLRNLLRAIDFLPLFYGVGLVSLLFTRDSQRLGDLVAGTLVVYQDPVETESLLPEPSSAEEAGPPLPAEQLTAIPNDLITLVSAYLRSRTELAPRPRQEIAAELVSLIREWGGLEPQPAQSAESFLLAVVRQAEQTAPWSSHTPVRAELPS